MNDDDRQQLAKVVECLSGWRAADTMTYAAIALYLYDFTITFSKEFTLMWMAQRKITVGSILFFIVRYSVFAGTVILLFLPSTVLTRNIITGLAFVAIVVSELILAVRTWLMWGRDRRMSLFFLILAIALLVPCGIVIGRDISGNTLAPPVSPLLEQFPRCQIFVSSVKSAWVVPYAMAMTFEFIAITLLVLRVVQWRRALPRQARSPLMDSLWKDGVMYFVFMFLFGGVNIGLILQQTTPQIRHSGGHLQGVVHSILSTRMVMNLASTGREQVNILSRTLTDVEACVLSDPSDEYGRTGVSDDGRPL